MKLLGRCISQTSLMVVKQAHIRVLCLHKVPYVWMFNSGERHSHTDAPTEHLNWQKFLSHFARTICHIRCARMAVREFIDNNSYLTPFERSAVGCTSSKHNPLFFIIFVARKTSVFLLKTKFLYETCVTSCSLERFADVLLLLVRARNISIRIRIRAFQLNVDFFIRILFKIVQQIVF